MPNFFNSSSFTKESLSFKSFKSVFPVFVTVTV